MKMGLIFYSLIVLSVWHPIYLEVSSHGTQMNMYKLHY